MKWNMWLSTFCAILMLCGFGCADEPQEPDAPLALTAAVHGKGQAAILVVRAVAQAEAPHTKVELTLPEGVSVVGVPSIAEADLTPGKAHQFRFPIKAVRPGAYIIGVKALAGADYYRFGKSISVAWIAQTD